MCVTIDQLPQPCTSAGKPRRVGVEVELGGLTEEHVADIVQAHLGGRIDTRPAQGRLVRDTSLGDIEVYLDSRYLADAETELEKRLRELASVVVPVEVVTEPLLPSDIPVLDDMLPKLRRAGATGTRAGILLGFGVHFNPEVTGTELSDILPVLTAFALYEDALRETAQIDISRRALPFVDPYPRALVDALARGGISDTAQLIDLYLKHAPSRNYALDMMALFAHLDPERVGKVMDLEPISARPTYHFRLPDCRVDEADWSLALEWNRWVLIERIAADAALLERLKSAWHAHRASYLTLRGDWTRTSLDLVQGAL
ncbi:amidoligase family protein [Puniceibacterium confluentis]|uniref:amidoligase family protein n=1 Tax=Puniceibacterium confluentis TaxID=1958944 RepID=UPI0011B7CFA5|nr:amidoligase family protein [Puniceibacterium confluentis]